MSLFVIEVGKNCAEWSTGDVLPEEVIGRGKSEDPIGSSHGNVHEASTVEQLLELPVAEREHLVDELGGALLPVAFESLGEDRVEGRNG